MSPMFKDTYGKKSFNNLYNFLKCIVSDESDFYTDSDKNRAQRIIDKINNYASVYKDDDNEEWIKINWFGEELRDILYYIFISYKFNSKENKDWFEEIKKNYEIISDPVYQQKLKLQHFSSDVTFLSDEKNVLLRKTKNLLDFLCIPTNKLILSITDFPSRYWQVYRDYKTKEDVFDIEETNEGWKVTESYKCKKENIMRHSVYTINIETLEKTDVSESKEYEETESED